MEFQFSLAPSPCCDYLSKSCYYSLVQGDQNTIENCDYFINTNVTKNVINNFMKTKSLY